MIADVSGRWAVGRLRKAAALLVLAAVLPAEVGSKARAGDGGGLLPPGPADDAGPAVIAGPAPAVEMAFVPGADGQPDGPSYDFRIGRYEVRNDQFAVFLNDALANLSNERGQYLYFDTDSGDVYLNDSALGETGTSGSGTLMFSAVVNAVIYFDGAAYAVIEGLEDHPASGVTWYGALKYCNWLTLASGLPFEERAYSEGPSTNLNAWRPVTISETNWATRDLDDAERAALVALRGYRLPMDGGFDDAAAYNEWYKAAAWDAAAGLNRVYGFGRDAIVGADANYRCSGDPFEDPFDCIIGWTTPVGYYDGTDHGGLFQTSADANAYGLFDTSGNLWEWVQDKGFSGSDRRNRGGSWISSSASLKLTPGAVREAGSAVNSTGFRVAQSVLESLLVTPEEGLASGGPWGGPYDEVETSIVYTLTNLIDADVAFTAAADAAWVQVSDDSTGGVVPAGGMVQVTVSLAPQCADGLTVGEHVSVVEIHNLRDDVITTREVSLGVEEPLAVSPTTGVTGTMAYGAAAPAGTTYLVSSVSDASVEWSATWEDTTASPPGVNWLTLNGAASAGGTVGPHGSVEVEVGFDPVVSTLATGTYTAEVSLVDDCTGTEFVRSVTLTVQAPLALTPENDVTSAGPFGGSFTPASHAFTLTNLLTSSVTWSVTVEPAVDWLSVAPTGGTLGGSANTTVTATITSGANDEPSGQHTATLRFVDAASGFAMERLVTLDVGGLEVEPDDDAAFAGPLGGPYSPESQTYTIYNSGLEEMPWTASFADTTVPSPGVAWLEMLPESGTILNPFGTADVLLAPSAAAAGLASGTYTGIITFTSKLTGATATRNVTLTIGGETFALSLAVVPGDDIQPGGPEHLFRVGRYEVTNAEYARFLNDAYANPEDDRGAYLTHDTAAGVVRLSGDSTTVFDSNVAGAISFADGAYTVAAGQEYEPVVGLSWYGALKFCNWLTLLQGMDAGERAYLEGANAIDWRPAAISAANYATRDLNATERADLVANYAGYRLPMDEGLAAASLYNEWYKAAAWDGAGGVNRLYGFGRDLLTNSDANFLSSGDPYESGRSPAGFYNGVNRLADGLTLTANTANAYDLYDMTGNVAEWVQDFGASAAFRATRGGSYLNTSTSGLLKTTGRNSQATNAAYGFVGFRVAQAIVPRELVVTPDVPLRGTGFAGGPYDVESVELTIQNDAPYTVDVLTVGLGAAWLGFDGLAPSQAPALTATPVTLQLTEEADALALSPAPSVPAALLPGSDVQPGGPTHDFWIGAYEVTNTEFATFLNDAYLDATSTAPGPRSEFLYFDTDSGSIYVNDEQAAGVGTDGGTLLSVLIYDAAIGRIAWNGTAFVVEAGFENHPVVGVSWYGAVKYCNWRTLVAGLPATLRVYAEAPSTNLIGWHPVVVDDATWASVGLDDTARARLVQETVGYRLPMDDEVGAASPYNEIYKAAAWDRRTGADHVYGFGRDALLAADANYFASGDTDEEGTTPVGFFNGANLLADGETVTASTNNARGLSDLCGNVAEWTQEFFASADSSQRCVRGGSWRDPSGSALLTAAGRAGYTPETTRDDLGFRVVRGTGHVAGVSVTDGITGTVHERYVILDVQEPLSLTPYSDASWSGMYGDAFSGSGQAYTWVNQSATDTGWSVTADADWVDAGDTAGGAAAGTLPAGGQIDIEVALNDTSDTLPPGDYTATVTLQNTTTGSTERRVVSLEIAQPLSVSPEEDEQIEFSGLFGGPFTAPQETQQVTLTSLVGFDLQYEVTADQNWVEVTSASPLEGTLAGLATANFDVSIGEEADGLAVGEHEANVSIIMTDPGNGTAWTLSRTIALTVDDLVGVAQAVDPWLVGPELSPLPEQTYTLTNYDLTNAIDMIVAVDQAWVTLSLADVSLLPGQQGTVTASLNEEALELYHGVYVATLSFTDTYTGAVQTRTIELTVHENLSIAPFDSFAAYGQAGGAATPAAFAYTLTNVDSEDGGDIQWAAAMDPDVPWLRINGGSVAAGALVEGGVVTIVVSVVPSETAAMADGTYETTVRFDDLTNAESVTRAVSLTIVTPSFPQARRTVSPASAQPAGPVYAFEMGEFHVTNAEFVAFLNDALANLANERGQYMFFDTATGDVYVNNATIGASGSSPTPRVTKMFAPAVGGRIAWDGGAYTVVTSPIDYTNHPVVGVSWYGAVKYCNWLTIDQGLGPAARCYAENTDANLNDWRPVTISLTDWAARDMNDAERLALVQDYRGYRLPMDDGHNNADVSTDTADGYNEWYKAAAWNDALNKNTVFGFGRDAITGSDANYKDSGDPFDNGTTPVGYYDGTDHGGAYQTSANANTFGLYDMSGNAYQWVQGRYNTNPGSIAFRTLRGGSWNKNATGSSSVEAARRTFAPPTTTDAQIGLRVLRTVLAGTGDADLDGDVDLGDAAVLTGCLLGPSAGVPAECGAFDLDGDGDTDLVDVSDVFVAFEGG